MVYCAHVPLRKLQSFAYQTITTKVYDQASLDYDSLSNLFLLFSNDNFFTVEPTPHFHFTLWERYFRASFATHRYSSHFLSHRRKCLPTCISKETKVSTVRCYNRQLYMSIVHIYAYCCYVVESNYNEDSQGDQFIMNIVYICYNWYIKTIMMLKTCINVTISLLKVGAPIGLNCPSLKTAGYTGVPSLQGNWYCHPADWY